MAMATTMRVLKDLRTTGWQSASDEGGGATEGEGKGAIAEKDAEGRKKKKSKK